MYDAVASLYQEPAGGDAGTDRAASCAAGVIGSHAGAWEFRRSGRLPVCAALSGEGSCLRQYAAAIRARLLDDIGSVSNDSPEDRFLRWLETRANMMDPLADEIEVCVRGLASKIPGLFEA